MLFSELVPLTEEEAAALPPRILAHLGDAVLHLYEREKEILHAVTVNQLHARLVQRVSAAGQSELLSCVEPYLSPAEAEIVRRARNVRGLGAGRKGKQAEYRRATAFEALIGYLYIVDLVRMKHLLELTETTIS